jgi:transcription initiation factor TFIID subunit 5
MTNTGLVSSHIPTPQNLTVAKTAAIQASPHAFNASQPALKLGLPPLGEKLKEEVKKILRTDRVAAPMDIDIDEKDETALGADGKPLAVPKDDDLLPMPINFRTFDVHREVSRIVDSRKRLRLGPTAGPSATTPEAKWEPGVEGRVVLPSICAYTFDDNGEGITCSEFSKDASLMAAGSEESCVRLWSLKGEKLRGIRSDFEASNVRDGASASSTLSEPHP